MSSIINTSKLACTKNIYPDLDVSIYIAIHWYKSIYFNRRIKVDTVHVSCNRALHSS